MMDKEKWLYPLIAGAAGVVISWFVQGYLAAQEEGSDAKRADEVERIVREIMVTDGGLSFHKALDDHMLAINQLTTAYSRDREETQKFREDYKEDQRITQEILRALSANRPGDPGP